MFDLFRVFYLKFFRFPESNIYLVLECNFFNLSLLNSSTFTHTLPQTILKCKVSVIRYNLEIKLSLFKVKRITWNVFFWGGGVTK